MDFYNELILDWDFYLDDVILQFGVESMVNSDDEFIQPSKIGEGTKRKEEDSQED